MNNTGRPRFQKGRSGRRQAQGNWRGQGPGAAAHGSLRSWPELRQFTDLPHIGGMSVERFKHRYGCPHRRLLGVRARLP